jgi:GNAT superfamily N-acetyltransferase
MPQSHPLAGLLPDLPRWVEARDSLLTGKVELFGLVETPALAVVIRDVREEAVVVVGQPAAGAVQAAVRPGIRGGLVAGAEAGGWLRAALPALACRRIILHTLANPARLPLAAPGQVRFLAPAQLPTLVLPPRLGAELSHAATYSRIAATFVDEQPVSFCYAGSVTENWWDVSIDTLPGYQRQGYAALCAAYMIRQQQEQGRQPVWAALASNPASWQLAQKLGFVAVDELVLFEQPE